MMLRHWHRFLLIICCLWIVGVEQVQAQESISPWVGQRLLRLIERSEEDPERSLEDMRKFAEGRGLNDTDRGFVYREWAALLMREDRMSEARGVLQSALEGKPDDYVPALRILLGQLLMIDGNSAEGLPQLEKWAAHVVNPTVAELALLGYAYLQEERYVDAATTFERVLETATIINDQWYEVLAYAYMQSGRRDDAIALLDSVIVLQPNEAGWWKQLGNIYLLMEQYGSGAASYAIADEVKSLDYEQGRRLAGIFSLLNMPADGAQILRSLFEKYPDQYDFEDQMLLGELWMLARELDKAIAAFETASLLAEDGEPALKISQLHLQWERFPEARDALLLAAEAYGEDTPEQVWYLLAVVEINLDNLVEASEALSRLDEDGEYGERAINLDRFIQNSLAASPP